MFAFCLKTKENFLISPANCGPVCICSPVKKRDILNIGCQLGERTAVMIQNDSNDVDNDTWLTAHLQETQDVWESCHGGHDAPFPAVHVLKPHCMSEEVSWLCWAHWSHWPHYKSKIK